MRKLEMIQCKTREQDGDLIIDFPDDRGLIIKPDNIESVKRKMIQLDDGTEFILTDYWYCSL
ncbi:MAG: hypothetical protein JXB26_01160 [Candidatus Aminicenantes bacterium]|nr:hypothetical protein [Candidatus Aminicenantes bacterium]